MLKLLVVGASGGLGSRLVHQALTRGHQVAVLVRSEEKLRAALSADDVARLSAVHVGDASDAGVVASASVGADVVISASPADAAIARTLASACRTAGARKLIWTAGSSNMFEADGVTPHYKTDKDQSMTEGFFRAHSAPISEIKDAAARNGLQWIIFCPGLMRPGVLSVPPPSIMTAPDPAARARWDFVCYEDAAHAVLTAAETGEYDGRHIQTLTLPESAGYDGAFVARLAAHA